MNVTLEITYQPKKGATVTFQSAQLSYEEAIVVLEDLQQTGRLQRYTVTDMYDSTWTLKELKKYATALIEEPHQVVVYFDGGFDKALQHAGLGVVIYYKQQQKMRLRTNHLLTHITSNNEAEYAALYEAMRALEDLGVCRQTITVKGDAEVVLQQMAGAYPVYDPVFERWANRIDALVEKLQLHMQYEHIARAHNTEAHRLATQALKQTSIHAVAPIVTKRQRRRTHD